VIQKADRSKLGYRVMLGVIVALLGLGMLLYLVPQGTSDVQTADVVAQVDGQSITVADVQTQLGRIERQGPIPPAMQPLYTQQILDQLVFAKELASEAKRLGIQVTDQERADRIREILPTAFAGDSFVGMEQYQQQVQTQTGLNVAEFEDLVTQALIEDKFRQLVTDGIVVTPDEIQQEFRRRNEKVKVQYAVIKPDDLQAKIDPSDADLSAYFDQNKSRYGVPERRVVRYALLDPEQAKSRVTVSDAEISSYYNDHLAQYKLEEKVHVAHILFKTVGRTDGKTEAQVQEMAEDVLKKAKSGADFAALAKQYSEDTTKDKGGDLDWIVRGQTVPEFEKAAFSLPKGSISDLVKTEYGFHIIKVIDRQTARTQPLDEVRATILASLQQDKAQQLADQLSEQIADEIRRSGRMPMDDLAKQFNLPVTETPPMEAGQQIAAAGSAPDLPDTIFRLRAGDISAPIRTDRGYVVLSVKEIQPAHPGTLAEVRDRVLSDYRRDKAVDLAKSRAEDAAKQLKAGDDFAKVGKALDLDVKTSDPFARNGSVPDIGSASAIPAAFTLPVGQAGDAVFLGSNWVVFRVTDHQQPSPDDLAKQTVEISLNLLDGKRGMAFEAFHTALEARLRQEGKLTFNQENMKRISSPA